MKLVEKDLEHVTVNFMVKDRNGNTRSVTENDFNIKNLQGTDKSGRLWYCGRPCCVNNGQRSVR